MSGKPIVFTADQIQSPHAPVGDFDLPNGVINADQLYKSITVREITGEEEDLLAAQRTPLYRKITLLLGQCVQQIGPYTDRTQLNQLLSTFTLTDRVYTLFCIRRVTLGDEFPFDDKCPSCSRESFWVQNLSELEVKPMPDPLRRVYTMELPTGRHATWHVMTAADEEKVAKLADDTARSTLGVLARLDLLNNAPVTLPDIKKISMRDMTALRADFDEKEGGLETTLKLECPYCNHAYEREVDIASSGFFFPSGVLKTWRAKFSSSSKPTKA